MKDKILAFLKAKLTGIPNAFLEGVSNQLATTITDEAQIETVCNTGLIASLKTAADYAQQEGDRRATTATDTAIKGYETKHNLKDGKSAANNQSDKSNQNQNQNTDEVPSYLKPFLAKLEAIEAKEAITAKANASKALLDSASALAKSKGAGNDKLLTKALKLITVEEGVTAEQLADKLLSEYNDFQSVLSGDGAVPQFSSRQLSDSEVETKRAAVVSKSAAEFKKNSTI